MLHLENTPHGRGDDVAVESTTRFFIEATDPETFSGEAWFRGSNLGRVDGYDTLGEATDAMADIDPYDHRIFRPALTGLRVVEETVTCRIEVRSKWLSS